MQLDTVAGSVVNRPEQPLEVWQSFPITGSGLQLLRMKTKLLTILTQVSSTMGLLALM